MLGKGSWQFDSEGSIVLSGSVVDYLDSVDAIDEAYGPALSVLEGEVVEAVYVVYGDDGWCYDAPVVLRLASTDLAVNSISGFRLAVGIEQMDEGRMVRILGCDDDPEGVFDGIAGDLRWRVHDCSGGIASTKIEQFYWVADGGYHPLALCCRLDSGVHLRIGDFDDQTVPRLGEPNDGSFMDEFDRHILPLGYPKPADSLPAFQDFMSIQGREVIIAVLDGALDSQFDNWWGRLFVGGYEVKAGLAYLSPPPKDHRVIGIDRLPEGVSGAFLLGKAAVLLPGKCLD